MSLERIFLSLNSLEKIADALGVNVNSLMEFDIELMVMYFLPLLFAIDETFDISIKDLDGEPGYILFQ